MKSSQFINKEKGKLDKTTHLAFFNLIKGFKNWMEQVLKNIPEYHIKQAIQTQKNSSCTKLPEVNRHFTKAWLLWVKNGANGTTKQSWFSPGGQGTDRKLLEAQISLVTFADGNM